MQRYRTADWRRFRGQVLAHHGGACQACGRDEGAGAVLQVHHRFYVAGRAPWEYDPDDCEVLCKGCHAAEHGKFRPAFGWEFQGWDDLEGLNGTCDCCGRAIRYVFLVHHEHWPAMEVGEFCCDNLTSTQVASGYMDSRRRYDSRLKRFIASSRWRRRRDGVEELRQRARTVELIPAGGYFWLRINGRSGQLRFSAPEAAKLKVFELIESGALDRYLAKARLYAPSIR